MNLATRELRTSALLFQVRRAIGSAKDKDKALKQCAACGALMDAFQVETARGLDLARARLKTHPGDDEALFFLGQIQPESRVAAPRDAGAQDRMGSSTGKRGRASTRSSHALHITLAHGSHAHGSTTSSTRGCRAGRAGCSAAATRSARCSRFAKRPAPTRTFFVHAEAAFALWDLHVREKDLVEATRLARDLARDFPENLESPRSSTRTIPIGAISPGANLH